MCDFHEKNGFISLRVCLTNLQQLISKLQVVLLSDAASRYLRNENTSILPAHDGDAQRLRPFRDGDTARLLYVRPITTTKTGFNLGFISTRMLRITGKFKRKKGRKTVLLKLTTIVYMVCSFFSSCSEQTSRSVKKRTWASELEEASGDTCYGTHIWSRKEKRETGWKRPEGEKVISGRKESLPVSPPLARLHRTE